MLSDSRDETNPYLAIGRASGCPVRRILTADDLVHALYLEDQRVGGIVIDVPSPKAHVENLRRISIEVPVSARPLFVWLNARSEEQIDGHGILSPMKGPTP